MKETLIMTFLKTLKLTTVASARPDPIVRRREGMIARLHDQLARISDEHHTRLKQRWMKVDGERRLTERRVPVRPWWRQQRDGSVVFTLKVGVSRVELDKGKAGIIVPSAAELPQLIEGLVAAVGRGELDAQLQAVAVGKKGKG
jgi:hypothetical protein